VRRAIRNALISMAGMGLLVAALIALDPRVREHATALVRKDVWTADIAIVQREVREAASVVAMTARDRSLDRAPIVVFVVASTALVLAMLRL
jgi:hypothetical protein